MDPQHKLRLCVPVCETTIEAARETIIRASKVADFVELRLDCLAPVEFARLSELQLLLGDLNVPVIITFRSREQGGKRELNANARHQFWLSWQDSTQDLRDIELDLALQPDSPLNPHEFARLVLSYHNFVGVPADLEKIYEIMSGTPARILKLAVQAHDVTDCIPMFQLLARARSENREMIAIAMGPAGIATRILGPSRGAFLTYAALDEQNTIAPGLLTVAELRNLYRIHNIDRETQVMGLVGLPVAHSVSAQMHNAAFESVEVNAVYMPFPVGDLASFLKRMIHPRTREIDWNIRGLSITAPYKNEVMTCLDWIDPAATEIGAVNTIVVEKDALHGYNTDASAFIQTISQSYEELRNTRCAVIGSGGAASAVVWGLRRTGTAITVFARDEIRAAALAHKFGVASGPLGDGTFGEFDLVVNATPLGTSGQLEDHSPASVDQLRGARLACDLVYNPQETLFLREARAAGCQTLGGLPMLVKQAAGQFRLWTKAPAPENVMRKAALEALEKD